MTIVNTETGEILSEQEERPTLETLIERGVCVQREVALLKSDSAAIAGQAKELYGVSKRDFNALVKYSFEKDIAADIEELQAIQAKLCSLGEQADLLEDEDD